MRFVSTHYDLDIKGWCANEIMFALEVLFSSERNFSQPGPIGEIGVHHGRFLIGAHNALGGARSLGIDIFEDQGRNVDGSGEGSLRSFREAISRFAVNGSQIDTMQIDSFDLTGRHLDEIYSRYGRFKLFSVDGGHTPEHAINDFKIAQDLTAQDGIILVDDFFSPHWPGVTEGIYRFLNSKQNKFAPFLLMTNKLFFTGISFHQRAIDFSRNIIQPLHHIEFRPISIGGYNAMSGVAFSGFSYDNVDAPVEASVSRSEATG
jgi:hypothetical protein